MAYVINKYDGTPLLVLEDGTLNTSTSIGLLGRNYVGYGETQNENFIFLLENFANTFPPPTPIDGQTWFNKETKALNVYTGETWVPVNSAIMSPTEPIASSGALWYKTNSEQLFLYDTDQWKLVGPEAINGFGITKWESTTILDSSDTLRPIVKGTIDDTVIAIVSKNNFIINPSVSVPGFSQINAGITLALEMSVTGRLIGNSSTASRLEIPRKINGVEFSGSSDITITSSTVGSLNAGNYILGTNYNGSSNTTWSVDASSSNIVGKVVVRDSAGDFSAGTIIADKFIGNVEGNVTAPIGKSKFDIIEANEIKGAAFSGNAFSSTRLNPGARINGVLFTGINNITVPVSGLDLTGSRLAPNVIESDLTTLGFLSSLRVQNTGISIGNSATFSFLVDETQSPVIRVNASKSLKIQINDSNQGDNRADFEFMPSDIALSLGGTSDPAFVGDSASKCNLGLPNRTFANVYSDNFVGIASSAKYADLAENYVSDLEYEPGTVLEFGGEFEVTLASDFSTKVAGVVSSNPAYLMNSECFGTYISAIALQGRVPCKVKGSIKKGDFLVSGGDGFARSCVDPKLGTVIGKSLEDFKGLNGVIEIAVGRL
jgi:hypothetical protein